MGFEEGKQFGLIAQELEAVFPELVKTHEEENFKSVNYIGLIPVLIEALKEQNEKINHLEEQLQKTLSGNTGEKTKKMILTR